MVENRKINTDLNIIDSDDVDTIDSLYSSNKSSKVENTELDAKFKKINLNKIPSEIIHESANNDDTNIFRTTPSPRVVGEQYKKSIEIKNNTELLIDPADFLKQIQVLVNNSDNTIKKLKDLQSKCSLGIVDLEHKLEFEELKEKEGLEILLLIKQLSKYKRYIKDTLDKFNSISDTIRKLDNSFTQAQLENLSKVEEFHSSRIYTPRIFNIVESKNYPAAKISLNTLESDIEELIQTTNKQQINNK